MVALPEILERHFSDASFLWSLRDKATRDPAYNPINLGSLDERVDAHLDGLALAQDAGWAVCQAGLDDEEPGTVFTAMFVAVSRRDLRSIAEVLNLGAESTILLRAMVAAFAWSSFADVNRVLPGLLDPRCPKELHYLGIAACASHRRDPGDALARALTSHDALLLSRSLKAAGELGRRDLIDHITGALGADDPRVCFWAAWSGGLFGNRDARYALLDMAGKNPEQLVYSTRACETAMRTLDVSHACDWLSSTSHAASPRVRLRGAAALGDPSMVPWILERMRDPELARAAGSAFHMLTGFDFSVTKFQGKAPENFASGPTDNPDDESVATDPDESLPWPGADAAEAWWKKNQKGMVAGERHLLGRPHKSSGWLARILRNGSQPLRAAAAEELCIAEGGPLFEIRSPLQRARRKPLSRERAREAS